MSGFIGWMMTPEFRRHLLTYIPLDVLLTMMMISKEFEETTREYITRRVESGEMIFHRGVDIVFDPLDCSQEEATEFAIATKERNKLVTQVVFLQNVPQIGDYACLLAVHLVFIDIPEGVESIGNRAFSNCSNLTTVSFPTTLTSIGDYAFERCSNLKNVDLLHTNLQELGQGTFAYCPELKSMMIPDSLQTLGFFAFRNCSKLVPSNIIVRDNAIDTTSEVVAHLRSQTSLNALLSGNNFLNTDDFRRLILPYLQGDTLMAIRLASKPWSRVADEFIGDGVESSAMIVHGGEDSQGIFEDFKERRKLITRVVFLLNITNIGENACFFAANLIVVDIPEGVESIGGRAFFRCDGLTTMFFPTTLKHIGEQAFTGCYSLENVDLLDTNLREIDYRAFEACSELKSMMIPDSLQTLGRHVFHRCSKLVPSNIEVDFEYNDTTSEVIAHLRSLQSPTT